MKAYRDKGHGDIPMSVMLEAARNAIQFQSRSIAFWWQGSYWTSFAPGPYLQDDESGIQLSGDELANWHIALMLAQGD